MKTKTFTLIIISCIIFTTNTFAGGAKTKKNVVNSTIGIATKVMVDTFQDLSAAEWSTFLKTESVESKPDCNLDALNNIETLKTTPELTKDEWNIFLKKNNKEQISNIIYE